MAQLDATEQLKEKGSEMLVKMIDFTVQSLGDVVEFSKQQIPDVIHQLLVWKATSSSVWLIVGIIFLWVMVIWAKKVNRWMEVDEESIVGHLLTAVFLAIGSALVINNLLDILQILVSPKIYLIEYAADLIKK